MTVTAALLSACASAAVYASARYALTRHWATRQRAELDADDSDRKSLPATNMSHARAAILPALLSLSGLLLSLATFIPALAVPVSLVATCQAAGLVVHLLIAFVDFRNAALVAPSLVSLAVALCLVAMGDTQTASALSWLPVPAQIPALIAALQAMRLLRPNTFDFPLHLAFRVMPLPLLCLWMRVPLMNDSAVLTIAALLLLGVQWSYQVWVMRGMWLIRRARFSGKKDSRRPQPIAVDANSTHTTTKAELSACNDDVGITFDAQLAVHRHMAHVSRTLSSTPCGDTSASSPALAMPLHPYSPAIVNRKRD